MTGIGSAHLDLFATFAWRNWQLLRRDGKCGIVLPRTAHTGSSLSDWRKNIIENGTFDLVTFLVIPLVGYLMESTVNMESD